MAVAPVVNMANLRRHPMIAPEFIPGRLLSASPSPPCGLRVYGLGCGVLCVRLAVLLQGETDGTDPAGAGGATDMGQTKEVKGRSWGLFPLPCPLTSASSFFSSPRHQKTPSPALFALVPSSAVATALLPALVPALFRFLV